MQLMGWQGYQHCGRHPYAFTSHNDVETWTELFVMMGRMCLIWVILWYVSLALTHVLVLPLLPRSKYDRENTTVYVSQKFVATAKALLVSYWANVSVYQL